MDPQAAAAGTTGQAQGLTLKWIRHAAAMGYMAQAARDDASLNQFIVTAVAEKISVLNTEALFQDRAQRSSKKRAVAPYLYAQAAMKSVAILSRY